jgi:hypothetical protein
VDGRSRDQKRPKKVRVMLDFPDRQSAADFVAGFVLDGKDVTAYLADQMDWSGGGIESFVVRDKGSRPEQFEMEELR